MANGICSGFLLRLIRRRRSALADGQRAARFPDYNHLYRCNRRAGLTVPAAEMGQIDIEASSIACTKSSHVAALPSWRSK